jgi:hypothetical protein
MSVELREKLSIAGKNRGWRPTTAQLEHAAAARAEKMRDPEWRATVYDKTRGENNPNYGKPMSEDMRKHLEESHWSKMRGKPRGPMSEETKRRISEAHQRRKEK